MTVSASDGTNTEKAAVTAVPHEVTNKTSEAQYYLVLNQPLRRRDHDDYIAQQYRALPPELQKRFRVALTGVPPTDATSMAGHVESTVKKYFGVFRIVGEVSPWKEFVGTQTGEGNEVDAVKGRGFKELLKTCVKIGRPLVLHFDRSTQHSKDELIGPVVKVIKDVALESQRYAGTGTHTAFTASRHEEEPEGKLVIVHSHLGGISRSTNPGSNFVARNCELLND